MSDGSKIEWTNATWNPVIGCSKVSAGCMHCYAEAMARRFGWCPKPWTSENATENVKIRPDRLLLPVRWTKPRMVFVNSMGDLFHELVDEDFVARVFAVMLASPRHTFQVLTKRAVRMWEILNSSNWDRLVAEKYRDMFGHLPTGVHRYNVWFGVTAENQAGADDRIPYLLESRALIHFVSCEPLLGPIDLTPYLRRQHGRDTRQGLDWVIVGGETGPGARPMDPDWARAIRDRCTATGTPFFFKRWSSPLRNRQLDGIIYSQLPYNSARMAAPGPWTR